MNAKDLRVGEIYFIYGFYDPEDMVPSVEPLKYVGKNCSSNKNLNVGSDYFVFLDAAELGRFKTENLLKGLGLDDSNTKLESSGQTETIISEGSLNGITDLDGLIEFFLAFRERKRV